MRKPKFNPKHFLMRNSSTILTGIGIAGVIGVAISTGFATAKAIKVVEKKERESNKKLEKLEVAKSVAPIFIPSVIVVTTTISCILGANILNKKQQAMLSSTCVMLSDNYRKYRDEVKRIYGEEAEKEILDNVIKSNFLDIKETYQELGEKVLFYDDWYGKYFQSTITDVKDAIYKTNRNFTIRGDAPLAEFWEMLGLEDNGIGYEYGWNSNWFWEQGLAPVLDFEIQKTSLEDNMECHVIWYVFDPIKNYEDEIY